MTTPAPSPSPESPAWSRGELTNPHQHDQKAAKVRDMFAAIARSYDLNNRLHSLWLDTRWRAFASKQASVTPGDSVLDVACGTGDLTQDLARRTPADHITGLDFTQEMLDLAAVKQQQLPADLAGRITYLQGDAQNLPFEDNSFDALTIAFGIRNVQEPPKAVREFARVLRPGGRLVILEFTRPPFAPVRIMSELYTSRIMPLTATVISRDKSGAYMYLPKSVEGFMSREELTGLISDSGFTDVTSRGLSLGICTCYRAVRAA